MDNSIINIKNELIEWIESLYDEDVLQRLVDLKNEQESASLAADINSETVKEENFDEQFAAGMTSDELMENIAAHIESISTDEDQTSM